MIGEPDWSTADADEHRPAARLRQDGGQPVAQPVGDRMQALIFAGLGQLIEGGIGAATAMPLAL